MKAAVGALSTSLSCGSLTPLYRSLVHDSACHGLADSLCWLWITSLVYCLAVLIMNTTRRAYQDDTILSNEEVKAMTAATAVDPGSGIEWTYSKKDMNELDLVVKESTR